MQTTYDIRPLQLRILDVMVAIDDLCRRHHLRYYLVAGTLLGAVRHRGFIPWDDDMDIAMPREDYEKLIAHADEWLPAPLVLKCGARNDTYPFTLGKIVDTSTTLVERRKLRYLGGICVDVFPIDNMVAPGFTRRWHNLRYFILRRLLFFRCRDPHKYKSFWKQLPTRLVTGLWSIKALQQKIDLTQAEFKDRPTPFVVDHDFHGERGIYPAEIFNETTLLTFEGHQFMAPAGYDAYLHQTYGDNYMQLPPEDQRVWHRYRYLNLNLPYDQYTGEY